VGVTLIVLPVPTKVPPQLPEYHLATAPVPALPPVKERLVLEPRVMDAGVAVAEVGVKEGIFAVRLIVRASPEPQSLLASTAIVPLDKPTIVVIEFVVELPVQPGGKPQV
jgi:hypothetical protein